jgi:hypothetical protein
LSFIIWHPFLFLFEVVRRFLSFFNLFSFGSFLFLLVFVAAVLVGRNLLLFLLVLGSLVYFMLLNRESVLSVRGSQASLRWFWALSCRRYRSGKVLLVNK